MGLRILSRKRTIFEASDVPMDPEDLKLQFRRRIVKIAFLIGIVILTYPIIQNKMLSFQVQREARVISETILRMRIMAAKSRSPYLLEQVNLNTWKISEFTNGEDCNQNLPHTQKDVIESVDMAWRPLFLDRKDESGVGVEAKQICLHPLKGITVDGRPLENSWLYLIVGPRTDIEMSRVEHARQVVVTNSGDDIQVLSVPEWR